MHNSINLSHVTYLWSAVIRGHVKVEPVRSKSETFVHFSQRIGVCSSSYNVLNAYN